MGIDALTSAMGGTVANSVVGQATANTFKLQINGFDTLVLIIILAMFAVMLTIVYLILSALEKSRIKKFTKPKKIAFKASFFKKALDDVMANKITKKIVRSVSNKLSSMNADTTASNDMKALFLIFFAIFFAFVIFLGMINIFGTKMWYLYGLYIITTIMILYMIIKFYADMKETTLSKQLPEALNDLKISYDNKKRLKLAIQEAYMNMPKDIKREFAKLAEADNFELAISELNERIRNPWFKMVLTLMLLTMQKGDQEGALSEQLQILNGIISQEILIRESSRLMLQLYKIFIVCTPAFAIFMRNVIKDMGEDISAYYDTIGANNMMAVVIIGSIILYFILDMLEQM